MIVAIDTVWRKGYTQFVHAAFVHLQHVAFTVAWISLMDTVHLIDLFVCSTNSSVFCMLSFQSGRLAEINSVSQHTAWFSGGYRVSYLKGSKKLEMFICI